MRIPNVRAPRIPGNISFIPTGRCGANARQRERERESASTMLITDCIMRSEIHRIFEIEIPRERKVKRYFKHYVDYYLPTCKTQLANYPDSRAPFLNVTRNYRCRLRPALRHALVLMRN